jgi:hypothetical protein
MRLSAYRVAATVEWVGGTGHCIGVKVKPFRKLGLLHYVPYVVRRYDSNEKFLKKLLSELAHMNNSFYVTRVNII